MYSEGSCEGHTVPPASRLLHSAQLCELLCNITFFVLHNPSPFEIAHGEPGQYSSVPILPLWR